MNVKIIVDSTADMTPELAAKVDIVPLSVLFGEKEYISGVDITSETFYEMLAQCQELPTTSQPAPYRFEAAFEKAVSQGCEVVCLTCSSKLSGTYQSACIAAEDYDGKVKVLDTRNIAIGLGILVEYAVRLAEQGLDAETIFRELTEKKEKVKLLALVDTLEYLKKGGRISSAVALAGGLLNIKPLICVEDGQLVILGKARGNRQGNSLMNQELRKAGGVDFSMPVLLGYTGASDELLKKYIQESGELWADHPESLQSSIVGSVVGTHVGPGTVAVSFFAAE